MSVVVVSISIAIEVTFILSLFGFFFVVVPVLLVIDTTALGNSRDLGFFVV